MPVPPDAIDRVHAGARRRQQRRSAVAALGAVAVIAVVAGAIGLNVGGGHGSSVAGNLSSARPSTSAAHTAIPLPLIVPVSGSPGVASSPPVAASSPAVAASPPVASVFSPVSVSAVGVNDYWVLGYMSTKTSDGYGISTAIMQTTDGGQDFQADATPDAFVGQAPISLPPDAPTISEIRFGDTNNGWLFGAKLFATTDGGASWSAVTGIPGAVVDLVASNGIAWAVVQTVSSSTASSSAVSDQYALWSTTYGKGSQAWTQVPLPINLGSTTPSIVDQDGTVTVMASGPPRALTRVHVLIASPGQSFTDNSGPCEQDLGGVLSNSKAGIWAECPHGNGASLWESSNSGESWASEPATGADVQTGAALGAIDNATAVVFDAANERLARISGKNATPTSLTGIDQVTFVGFTNPGVGFAVAVGDDLSALLYRTTDGGQTWTAVTF